MPAAEIQTDAIVRHALAAGKHVFVPYLHRSSLETPDTPARVMDMVRLESLQDYESLGRDRWGIPSVDPATVHSRPRILGEPGVLRSDLATLDMMVMPGVAFDVDQAGSVRRLGHGKGFYDLFINRYLSAIEGKELADHEIGKENGDIKRPSLSLYGLALAEQLIPATSDEQVPTGPHDRTLHGLILGNGEIKTSTLFNGTGQS